MKFYIAARFGLKDLVRSMHQQLRERGHKVIGDWTSHKEAKPYDKNTELAREYATEDVSSARKCDVFVLVSDEAGTGMYVELGAAISSNLDKGKPQIYVIGNNTSRSMFYFHPSVICKNNLDEVLREVEEPGPNK